MKEVSIKKTKELQKLLTPILLSGDLKDAGVPQKSEYYWYRQVGGIICDTDVRGKWRSALYI
jgi:hypothetical protein